MSDLELLRAYTEGALPPDAHEAFAARLRDEPELAELAEVYGLVLQATAQPAPVPESTFEDVARRALRRGRRPLLRMAAVAALLLAMLGAGLWWRGHETAPAGVRLASIPLAQLPEPQAPPAWPRSLAHYATSDEEGLVWSHDLEEGLAVARVAGRPVFLFIDYQGCPWCKEFKEVHSRDEGVVKAADDFVLVNIPWGEAPPELRTDPRDGWPIYDVLDPAGRKVDGYLGLRPPAEVAAFLREAAQKLKATGDYRFVPWEELRKGARALAAAERAADAGERLARLREAEDGPLGAAARAGIDEMEFEAQRALFAARDLPPAGARAELERAATALHGTPWAADLARVAAYVAEHGAFPRLEEAK